MTVIVKVKANFSMVQYDGVKNIAYDGTNYTLTLADNSTVTYAKATHYIMLFMEV